MWRIERYCTAKSAIFEAAGKMAMKADQTAKLASSEGGVEGGGDEHQAGPDIAPAIRISSPRSRPAGGM